MDGKGEDWRKERVGIKVPQFFLAQSEIGAHALL